MAGGSKSIRDPVVRHIPKFGGELWYVDGVGGSGTINADISRAIVSAYAWNEEYIAREYNSMRRYY